MGLQIVWASSAAAEYDRLPDAIRERIDAALLRMAIYQEGDVKRLRGTPAPEYRLRVGAYRVRFEMPPGAATIVVLHVFTRGSGYGG